MKSLTTKQRNGVIHFLKLRISELQELNPDWFKATQSWKNEYYYPTLRAKLKLEDGNLNKLTKTEVLHIISCIRSNAPVTKVINEAGYEYEKIESPFLEALNLFKKMK